MFLEYYNFTPCGKDRSRVRPHLLETYLFRFKDHRRHTYIVEVEEYDHHFFAIKFYLKAHKLSPDRYSFTTGIGVPSRILATCIQIMLYFHAQDGQASFGFIGANSIGEKKAKTKRFRVYSRIMNLFFSPTNFLHLQYSDQSGYLMINTDCLRNNPNLVVLVTEMFADLFKS